MKDLKREAVKEPRLCVLNISINRVKKMTIPVLPSSDNCFFPQANDFLDKAIPTTPALPPLLVEIGDQEISLN